MFGLVTAVILSVGLGAISVFSGLATFGTRLRLDDLLVWLLIAAASLIFLAIYFADVSGAV